MRYGLQRESRYADGCRPQLFRRTPEELIAAQSIRIASRVSEQERPPRALGYINASGRLVERLQPALATHQDEGSPHRGDRERGEGGAVTKPILFTIMEGQEDAFADLGLESIESTLAIGAEQVAPLQVLH